MKNAKEYLKQKFDATEAFLSDCTFTYSQMLDALEGYNKFKPKKEVKRYFSASYQGFYNDGTIRGGNVHFDCNTYPPRWWIEDKIKELDPGIYRAMILSIQEMTKEDYESFVSKEN